MSNILQNKVLLTIVGVVAVGALAYGVYSFTQTDDSQPTKDNSSQAIGTSSNSTDQQAKVESENQLVEGRLVDGFPGDKIPLYLGDIVDSKQSSDSADRAEYNVRIKTTDSFEKVDKWTRISYVNEGWEIRSDNKTGLGGVMLIAHSDEYINTITYDEQDGVVMINYGISAK